MTNKLTTRLISTLIAMLMILSAFSGITAFAEREYAADVSINGILVDFANHPYSEYNTVFVPLEELCDYINLTLSRDGNSYIITRMSNTVKLDAENMVIKVNGENLLMESPCVERNGILYAPIDIFSVGFKMPVELSENFRSVDIKPNIYSINIDDRHAAGISAVAPDKDTLATGTSDSDALFYNDTKYPHPELEKSIYYMVDYSEFVGKDILKAELMVNAGINSNLYPTLSFIKTALWDKAAINYLNQPKEFPEMKTAAVRLSGSQYKQGGKTFVPMTFDITALTKSAVAEEGKLSLKALGVPYNTSSDPTQVVVQGVNTAGAPCVQVTVNENYTFPVKQSKSEYADDDKYSELQLLRSMGVFTEDDEFPLDMSEPVTRAEFLTYAMRLRGSDIPVGSSEQFFSDVPTDSGYFAVTSSAFELGYISGWQGIAFRPYDDITIAEAITILGRMLNYDVYADERGGFTPGYFAAAKYGDLYLGVNDNTTSVSFNLMVDLMENALDAKMLDVVSYTSDGKAEYIFNEDMTILTEYWNAQEIKGVVTANEYGSITPGTNGEEGCIQIDGKRLKLNYESYNKYLGYKVRGYYSKTEDVLLYIGTVVNGQVTEIDLSDIEGVSDSASTVTFSYTKANGKRATESFSRDAVVIYNGKSVGRANITSALLKADGGKITLVGTDLVTITAYQTIVVAAVDSEEGEEVIYDLYEDYTKALRLKNIDWSLDDKDGKKLEISSLKKYDVVSVAKSLDGQLVKAIVSTKKVEGKVSSVEKSGSPDMRVTIGGVEYELRNLSVSADFDGDKYWSENVKLGSDGTFLLNYEGHIVGFYSAKKNNILGYIVDIQPNGRRGLNKELEAAVFVQGSEEFVIYNLADKVTIDGNKLKNFDEITAYFMEKDEYGAPTDVFKKQGIIFDINSDREINRIDTAYFDEEHEIDRDATLYLANKPTDPALRFKSAGKLGDKFNWTLSESLMICQPEDAQSYEDYMVITSGMRHDSDYSPEIYCVGTRTPRVSILVLEDFAPGSNAGSTYCVVDEIVTAYNDEDYEVKKLYYYTKPGERSSVIIPDEKVSQLYQENNTNVVGKVERGDIIRIGLDARGELSTIVENYDYRTKTLSGMVSDFNAQNRYYGGYVYETAEEVFVRLTPDVNNPMATFYWVDTTELPAIYRYEVYSGGVELFNAGLADMRPYDNVPYDPSGLLLYNTYATAGGSAFVLDMSQPSNTGIYKVTYSLGDDVDDTITGFKDEDAATEDLADYSVRFNPGDTVPVTSSTLSRTDHDFLGWKINGTGETIEPGGTFIINGDVTLVAVWRNNPTYTFTFADESGTLSITKQWSIINPDTGDSIEQLLPTATDLYREGYTVIGWKHPDGTVYTPGTAYTTDITADVGGKTFTAVWKESWTGKIAVNTPATEVIDGKTYYLLDTAEDLAWFSHAVDGELRDAGGYNITATPDINAKLVSDIYINNFTKPDGTFDAEWYKTSGNVTSANSWSGFRIGATNTYTGIFDGNGKAIYGLYTRGERNGLFDKVGGEIKNLNIAGGYLVGTTTTSSATANYHGMVASFLYIPAKLTDITAEGLLTCVDNGYIHATGGIAGFAGNGTAQTRIVIENCTSKVDIDSSNGGTHVEESATYMTNVASGGIIGLINTSSTGVDIKNCTNEGNINMPYTRHVGGILGACKYATVKLEGTNTNKGAITGYDLVGQIVGASRANSLSDSVVNSNMDTCLGSVTITKP